VVELKLRAVHGYVQQEKKSIAILESTIIPDDEFLRELVIPVEHRRLKARIVLVFQWDEEAE
jgi:hypothetical protein